MRLTVAKTLRVLALLSLAITADRDNYTNKHYLILTILTQPKNLLILCHLHQAQVLYHS
jgi:hypothetical protein